MAHPTVRLVCREPENVLPNATPEPIFGAWTVRRPPCRFCHPRVVELAGRLAALCRCTEAEAVLQALENEIARTESRLTLAERIKPLQDRIATLPRTGLEADKDFLDDLCGDA